MHFSRQSIANAKVNIESLTATFHICCIYIVVLTALDLAPIVIDRYSIAAPFFGAYMPYGGVLLIPILWANGTLRSKNGRVSLPIDTIDICFLAMIATWTVIELIHQLQENLSDWRLIGGYCWLWILFYTLRSFDYRPTYRQHVIDAIVVLTGLTSVSQLLFYTGALGGEIGNWNLLRETPVAPYVNRFSYIAVLGVGVLLFCARPSSGATKIIFVSFAAAHIALIRINHTRGAVLILLLLGVLKITQMLGVRRALVTAIICVGLTATALIAGGRVGEMLLEDVLHEISLGRGFVGEGSVALRVGSTRMAIQSWAESPWLGLGNAGASEIRYKGMLTHVHYVHVLVAVGMVGIVPYMLAFLRLMGKPGRAAMGQRAALLGIGAGVASLEPDIQWWYGLIAYLVWTATAHPNKHAERGRSLAVPRDRERRGREK